MVQLVIGSILHDGPMIELFLDWCNMGCSMCYPVCGIVHIKDPFLLIEKSSRCSGGSGFLLSLSEWSFTIRPTHITILKCVECVVK